MVLVDVISEVVTTKMMYGLSLEHPTTTRLIFIKTSR